MLRSLELNHFRCFRSARASDLGAINVIVGSNASGKTSLLESLYIAATGLVAPAAILTLRNFRYQISEFATLSDLSSNSELWEDLFTNFDTDNEMSISITGDAGETRKLTIVKSSELSLPLDSAPKRGASPVSFFWQSEMGTIDLLPSLRNQSVTRGDLDKASIPTCIFSSSILERAESLANQYSAISKDNEELDLLKMVQREFPLIEGLSLEMERSIPRIFAQVSGIDRKIPLAMVSDGITKLLNILLGIYTARGGIVLIDQIEDGFYFQRLESIWRLIRDVAARWRVQLFITTHSKECLDALISTISSSEESFRLLRTTQDSRVGTEIESISGHKLAAALKQHVEIR